MASGWVQLNQLISFNGEWGSRLIIIGWQRKYKLQNLRDMGVLALCQKMAWLSQYLARSCGKVNLITVDIHASPQEKAVAPYPTP